jgi:hypothetical protein
LQDSRPQLLDRWNLHVWEGVVTNCFVKIDEVKQGVQPSTKSRNYGFKSNLKTVKNYHKEASRRNLDANNKMWTTHRSPPPKTQVCHKDEAKNTIWISKKSIVASKEIEW